MNEDYWFVKEPYMEVWCSEFTYAEIDIEHLETGNCFKTEMEANKHLESTKIERMANPKQPSDYGLSISVNSKEETEEIFNLLEETKRNNRDGLNIN